jgi:hypothetical protein
MTHTPGPWHIGVRTAHSKRDVYGERGELVALADAVFTDLATAQANARLIAAAPDLLSQCETVLAAWRGIGPVIDADKLESAIARAKGQS